MVKIKEINSFNTQPCFPFTYGESIENDGKRLSDSIIKLISDHNFRRSLKSTLMIMILVGSYSLPVKASDLNDPANLANEVLGSKGAKIAFKEIAETALKLARSKPSLIAATTLVCSASYPLPPATTNWALSVACGILISETLK